MDKLRYYGDHLRAIMAEAKRRDAVRKAGGRIEILPESTEEFWMHAAVSAIEAMDVLKRKTLTDKIRQSEGSDEEKALLLKQCDLSYEQDG